MILSESLIIHISENGIYENAPLTPEQAAALKNHFAKYVSVTKRFTGDGFDLSASGYVGTLVLDDLHIHIVPKVPVNNLFHMLAYAYDLPRFQSSPTLIQESDDLFEIVAQAFVRQVDDLVRQGIHRGYVDEEEDRRFLRGRLLLGPHLRRNVVHASRFYVRTNEFSADLLENRILKATLGRLSSFRFRTSHLNQQIRRTWSAFSEVSSVDIAAPDCDDVLYNRLNARYRSPLNLARLLLQHVSLEHHSGQNLFAAFVLPMYEVFERFVAGYLDEAFDSHPHITVSSQERIWFDNEKSLRGKPDIVVRQHNKPFLVLDTKYKIYGDKPKPDDLYQMVTYGQYYRINRAVLAYPTDYKVDETKTLVWGMTVHTLSLSLAGSLDAFKRNCRLFAERVAQDASPEAL